MKRKAYIYCILQNGICQKVYKYKGTIWCKTAQNVPGHRPLLLVLWVLLGVRLPKIAGKFNFLVLYAGKKLSHRMSLCVYTAVVHTNVQSLRYSFFFELKFLILTAVASEMNPKGISNLGNTRFLNSVLQGLLSVTCFVEGLAGVKHNRKKYTSSRTGIENLHCRLVREQ